MRKLLLTSAGFENKNIEKKFLELVEIEKEKVKVLFIPTAAISDEAKYFVKICREELINAGILDENIIAFNLDRKINFEDMKGFNVIYFCGGTTEHLLIEVNKSGFNKPLKEFVDNGGVYMGVSAGSLITAKNLENNLGYLNCRLKVHCDVGHNGGELNTEDCPSIQLTDNQAILILDDKVSVIQ